MIRTEVGKPRNSSWLRASNHTVNKWQEGGAKPKRARGKFGIFVVQQIDKDFSSRFSGRGASVSFRQGFPQCFFRLIVSTLWRSAREFRRSGLPLPALDTGS
jgi:hypothetical protein